MAKCLNCNDTGRNPGSDYLDCTKCEAASEIALRQARANNNAEIAALVLAARQMWGWAIQIGEQFHPSNEVERAEWKKQCDDTAKLLRKYPPHQQ